MADVWQSSIVMISGTGEHNSCVMNLPGSRPEHHGQSQV